MINNKIKNYLNKHEVKNHGWVIEYDNIKSAIIGSLPHRVTMYKDQMFLFGKSFFETFKDR